LIRFHTGSGRVMVRKITSGIGVHLSGPAPAYDSRFDLGGGEEL
jgi:hypothetical protein